MQSFFSNSELVSNLKNWVKKGSLSIIDQALFSIANFAVNILLARWLPEKQYGAFSLTYTIMLFLNILHTSFITEPMLIFGSTKFRLTFQTYIDYLLKANIALSVAIGFVAYFAAKLLGSYISFELQLAITGLALALPAIFLFWTTRRAFYAMNKPKFSAIGSFAYLITVLGLLNIFNQQEILSTFSAFLLLGISSFISSVILGFFLNTRLMKIQSERNSSRIFKEHFTYGKWSAVAELLYWTSGQIIVFIMPISINIEANAIWSAILNIFRPVSLFMQSITPLLIPQIAANKSNLGIRKIKYITLIISLFVLVYGTIVSIFSEKIIDFLYSGKYIQQNYLTIIFSFALIASSISQINFIYLKANNKIKTPSKIRAISTLILLVIALPLTKHLGVFGGALALSISYAVIALISTYNVYKPNAKLN